MDSFTASMWSQVNERKLAAVAQEDYALAQKYKAIEERWKPELSQLVSAKVGTHRLLTRKATIQF